MSHEQLHDRLLDLVYGELTPREAREVEEHAAGCEECRIELARIRETRRLMSGLPHEPAPPAGERLLVAAAREAARRRAPPRTLPRWLWSGSIVAASLAAVVTISYRIVATHPEPMGREDPGALMGDSPYARAPGNVEPAPPPGAEKPATAAEPAPVEPERKTAAAPRRERAGAAPRSAAPEPDRAPPRFAAAPPAPPTAEHADAPAAAATPAAPPPAEASPGVAAGPSARERRQEPREAYATADHARAAGSEETSARAPPPPAAPAPRSGAKAPAPAASRAAELAAPAGADPLARYEALRAAGRLRAEERTFPGCELELWRRVERDPDGRVVSYAWEQMVGTRRVRLEAIYGPDGTLARKRALDVASSAPEAVKFTVPPAASVDIEAPSRCDR